MADRRDLGGHVRFASRWRLVGENLIRGRARRPDYLGLPFGLALDGLTAAEKFCRGHHP